MLKKPQTLPQCLAYAVARAIVITAALVGSFLVTSGGQDAPTSGDVMDGRPNAKGSPAWLIERHDCQPVSGGAIPSAVVIRYEDESTSTYRTSDKAIGDAIDFEIDDVDNGVAHVDRMCA